jgi:predicted dinucleotide-binding enzyme
VKDPHEAHRLKVAGPEKFRGKVVIDTTNPLDFSGGMPPKLAVAGNDSAGEHVQRLLPDARVVKAFNTARRRKRERVTWGRERWGRFHVLLRVPKPVEIDWPTSGLDFADID